MIASTDHATTDAPSVSQHILREQFALRGGVSISTASLTCSLAFHLPRIPTGHKPGATFRDQQHQDTEYRYTPFRIQG